MIEQDHLKFKAADADKDGSLNAKEYCAFELHYLADEEYFYPLANNYYICTFTLRCRLIKSYYNVTDTTRLPSRYL
jgi:hypothetical protein